MALEPTHKGIPKKPENGEVKAPSQAGTDKMAEEEQNAFANGNLEDAPILDVPQIKIPSANSPDDKSKAEAQALAEGNLEEVARSNKHRRDEKFKDHVSRARSFVFWFLIGCFMFMTVVLVIHWATPWSFLTPQQLEVIKAIIGAALASKIFSDQAKHIS